jgi:hypothetical protein
MDTAPASLGVQEEKFRSYLNLTFSKNDSNAEINPDV